MKTHVPAIRPLVLSAGLACLALVAACTPSPASEGTSTAAAGPEAAATAARAAELESRIQALQTPPADATPRVYFANLKEGDVVSSPLRVMFGASGIGVAPAGTVKENTGHHHLLIDTTLSEEEKAYAIPNDAQHLHFGGGQTETVIELAPGSHTLQLAFGDLNHELHKPAAIMSEVITITVK